MKLQPFMPIQMHLVQGREKGCLLGVSNNLNFVTGLFYWQLYQYIAVMLSHI